MPLLTRVPTTRKLRKELRHNAHSVAARVRFQLGGRPIWRRRAHSAVKALSAGIAYGVLVEPKLIETTNVTVPIRGLSPRLEGYRIALLSDVHYSPRLGRQFLRNVVRRTNALDPDLVALPGDFISRRADQLDPCFSLLSDLKAPDGCWVTRGNHDHHVPLETLRRACREVGFRFLENEHRTIRPERQRHQRGTHLGRGGDRPSIVLAGVGDLWEGECSPGRALAGAPAETPTLLLSHNPHCADLLLEGQRVDLMLSGHTHGGQVRPLGRRFSAFSDGCLKYVSGLVETPTSRVYISRGVGTSAFHFRWNCRPEIALIQLVPA